MSETYEQAMTRTGFTELPAVARAGASPLLVLQIGCDACSGVFVADGELAWRLRAMPAHTAVMTGGMPPTADERAAYLAEAGRHACDAGWVMLVDGQWRCPHCRERWGDRPPRRFTIREVVARHARTR